MTPTTEKDAIRPDYHRKTTWTYAEAAAFTGRTVKTIGRWLREPIDGKFRFKVALGPTKWPIDALSFRRYIETGEPQGAPFMTRRRRTRTRNR